MTGGRAGAWDPSPRLVVTADDFGLDPAVNGAVARAHAEGVLTAASLMVGAPAAGEAVEIARSLPGLAVGLHVVLTESAPVSPPETVPALIGPDGRFRRDLALHGARIFLDPAARRQMRAEVAAQFAAFRATGLVLDHVDAHQHFHLHPSVAEAVVAEAVRAGAPALRVPLEPAGPLLDLEPRADLRLHRIVGLWARRLARRVRAAGLATADRVFGLAWTGAMTEERLAGLLARPLAGLTEIYLHPALSDAFPGSAPGYRYGDELAALLSPAVRRRADGFRRGGFQHLLRQRAAA